MFVANIKISKPKKLFLLCGALSAAAMLCMLVFVRVNAPKNTAECKGIGEYSTAAETPLQRIEFLEQFGIAATESACDEIIVPAQFNSIYEDYNALQQTIGLDLAPYKGKRAERYTFTLDTASPDSGACAVLLVRSGRVIGGHLTDGAFGNPYRALCEYSHGSTG